MPLAFESLDDRMQACIEKKEDRRHGFKLIRCKLVWHSLQVAHMGPKEEFAIKVVQPPPIRQVQAQVLGPAPLAGPPAAASAGEAEEEGGFNLEELIEEIINEEERAIAEDNLAYAADNVDEDPPEPDEEDAAVAFIAVNADDRDDHDGEPGEHVDEVGEPSHAAVDVVDDAPPREQRAALLNHFTELWLRCRRSKMPR